MKTKGLWCVMVGLELVIGSAAQAGLYTETFSGMSNANGSAAAIYANSGILDNKAQTPNTIFTEASTRMDATVYLYRTDWGNPNNHYIGEPGFPNGAPPAEWGNYPAAMLFGVPMDDFPGATGHILTMAGDPNGDLTATRRFEGVTMVPYHWIYPGASIRVVALNSSNAEIFSQTISPNLTGTTTAYTIDFGDLPYDSTMSLKVVDALGTSNPMSGGYWAIDNLSWSEVPEPGTVLLLSFGWVLGLLRRKR